MIMWTARASLWLQSVWLCLQLMGGVQFYSGSEIAGITKWDAGLTLAAVLTERRRSKSDKQVAVKRSQQNVRDSTDSLCQRERNKKRKCCEKFVRDHHVQVFVMLAASLCSASALFTVFLRVRLTALRHRAVGDHSWAQMPMERPIHVHSKRAPCTEPSELFPHHRPDVKYEARMSLDT